MDSPRALLLQSINLIQGYNLKSETSESLLDDLRESLEKLEECTPDTELPQELTEVIKLNLHCIYETSKGFQSDGCYSMLITTIGSWTNKSKVLAHEINCRGLLIYHINHLNSIRMKAMDADEEELEHLSLHQFVILHNCLGDCELPRYYLSRVIKWEVLLSPWLHSAHSTIRLMSKFILGHCHDSLSAEDEDLLALDDNDLNLVIDLMQRGSEEPFTANMIGPIKTPLIQLLSNIASSNSSQGQDLCASLPLQLANICISNNQLDAIIDVEDISDGGCTISTCEVLVAIENLMSAMSNRRLLEHKEFCPLLLKILTGGGFEEKAAATKLVWSLSYYSLTFQAELSVADSALSLALNFDNSELNIFSKCATLSAKVTASHDEVLFLIEQCYKFHKYKQCVQFCQKLTDCTEADIYQAKSLYYLYTQEQALVADLPSSVPVRELREKHAAFSSKAREVIAKLLKVSLKEDARFDDECSEILDLAMIDYAYETNKLSDAKHCLFCRKYKGYSKEESGMESAAKKSMNQQHGLKASHLFPESIIRRFVEAVPLVKGKKVCSIQGIKTGLILKEDVLHSSGECKLYLFCHDCEEMFSASESWFARCFFDKLYNIHSPSSSKAAQDIPYNHHLYRFCVSMVFRVLRYEAIKYLNSADIYNVFSLCRMYLLSSAPESLPLKPEIFMFISHLGEEDEDLGSINTFLAATLTGLIGFAPLDANLETLLDTTPAFAHFLVIHMGIVNILVKFRPSANYEIDSRFQISERGGLYQVPDNNERKILLPPGVFSVFQKLAMKMDTRMLEGPSLAYDPLCYPDESKDVAFGILDAESKDENAIINKKGLSIVSPTHTRSICFLPHGFKSCPLLSVPENHHILLHHTHGGTGEGTIIFICVGLEENKGYGLERPYIVLYNYKPGLVLTTGFIVSIDDLSFVDFLPKSKGISSTKMRSEAIDNLRESNFSSVIQCTMREKGFYSLKSLLCRVKFARKLLPQLHFDAQCTPCSTEELTRCGYCINLCDTCFKPTPVNPLTAQPPEEECDMSFKFCSQLCYEVSVVPPKSDSYFIADKEGALYSVNSELMLTGRKGFIVPSCGPLLDSHSAHLHSLCLSTNWAGYLKLTELTLCSGMFKGNTQYYVVYRGRSLTGQQCLEFFVSDDLSPTLLLPHIEDKDASDTLEDLISDGVIKQQLWKVTSLLCEECSIDIVQFSISWLIDHIPAALARLDKGKHQKPHSC